MNKRELLSIPFCVILLFACNNEDLSPEILGSSIESNHKRQELYIPYADSVELKELAQNKKVLDFELARKITLLEMNETGFVQDMGWNGYHLAPNPVVIYNLESWPKFYDFIAFDSENNAIGTIRVNANRKNSSVINGVYSSVFDYNEFLTKSNASNPSIFMDWKGEQFVGVRSKGGKAPKQIISVDNGTPVLMENMRELEGEEIIQHTTETIAIHHLTCSTSLRSDFQHTISSLNTIQSTSSSVFQNFNFLNIIWIQCQKSIR